MLTEEPCTEDVLVLLLGLLGWGSELDPATTERLATVEAHVCERKGWTPVRCKGAAKGKRVLLARKGKKLDSPLA